MTDNNVIQTEFNQLEKPKKPRSEKQIKQLEELNINKKIKAQATKMLEEKIKTPSNSLDDDYKQKIDKIHSYIIQKEEKKKEKEIEKKVIQKLKQQQKLQKQQYQEEEYEEEEYEDEEIQNINQQFNLFGKKRF